MDTLVYYLLVHSFYYNGMHSRERKNTPPCYLILTSKQTQVLDGISNIYRDR
jgi:hypothetical protein